MASFIAEKAGEWAGIPTSIEGEEIVVEPSYPFAKIFNERREKDNAEEAKNARIINQWFCKKHRCDVVIFEDFGKRCRAYMPAWNNLDMALRTMGCSVACGIEQESKALQLMAGMLRHHQFKQYLMTGMFIETSQRSQVSYIFRKLRPTVALSKRTGDMRILACLCMHPIGYYSQSWAGSMTPTDDVIAHLAMMRGDEPMFWKRCTQHPPHRPEAGL